MSNDLCVDPGYARTGDGCACALATGGLIRAAWFERPRHGHSLLMPVAVQLDRVIVEQPQQDGRSWGVPPEVLMRLSWEGALLGGVYAGAHGAKFEATTPSGWKGSEPKPVQHGRLWAVLSDIERALLGGSPTERQIYAARRKGALGRWKKPGGSYYPANWLGHNLLDAAAMTAIFSGRLKKA